ncbi:MAG: RNA methyltransferase [Lentisphaeria bacterium]|nr:RNA methyltransferase [Lentisphaeria bacterium]
MSFTQLPQKKVKELLQLQTRQGRKKSGLFYCEGERICGEALKQAPDLVEYVILEEGKENLLPSLINLKIFLVDAKTATKISMTSTFPGIMCVMRKPEPCYEDSTEPIIVLDRVMDPGNTGTILRTAWSLGYKQIVVVQGTCDLYSDKVVRSTMGAIFALNIIYIKQLSELSLLIEKPVFVADIGPKTISCYEEEFQLQNACLVLGNEANGPDELEGATSVMIPMPGHAESLNVAQAATILMFEDYRKKIVK